MLDDSVQARFTLQHWPTFKAEDVMASVKERLKMLN